MNQSFLLWRLQKIDTSIDQIQSRLKEIEAKINADQTVAASQAVLAARDQAHKQARALQKKREADVATQHIKIETDEASLYSGRIHNPKELKDLQDEVASLKRHLANLEDLQLEAMIQVDQAESDLEEARKSHDRVLASFAVQSASLLGEKNALNARLENLQVERKPALVSIEAASLAHYQQLREQKRGVAVATVEDDSCSACGADLRPEERQAAKSPHAISHCSHCGRILYAG